MNKKVTDSAIAKIIILGFLILTVVLFIFASTITKSLFSKYPYIILSILIISSVFIVSGLVSLLYEFYEAPKPLGRFVPLFGELYLLDIKFRKVIMILYSIITLLLVTVLIPYNIKLALGQWFALNSTFYIFFIAGIIFVISQLLYGIGLSNTVKDISNEWSAIIKTDIGVLKHYAWFGFIPIIRFFTFYALYKPLSTLVVYYNTTSYSDEVYEEESETYDEYGYDDDDDDDDD